VYSLEYIGILGNTREYQKYHGIPKNVREYYGIPWNTLEYILEYQGIHAKNAITQSNKLRFDIFCHIFVSC
jgi:hypothetical protein